MARISSLVTLGVTALLALAAAGARADGVAYPSSPSPASMTGPVYGGWTSPQPGGYGTWTTSPDSPRSYGPASRPSVPASAAVASTAPSAGWAGPACGPVATMDEPCAPNGWRFGASARYWRPSIRGDVLITIGGLPGSGTSADVERDLGLDHADAWEAGVSVAYGRHRGTFGYEVDSFSGTNRLGRPIVYHGVTFPAGTDIRSDVELTFWKLGYDYAFVGGYERGMMGVAEKSWTIRAGLSGWLWGYEGRIRSTTPSADTARAFSHLLPVATVAAEGSFDRIEARARLAGGWLASDRYVLDVEASVGVRLWDRATFELGYRWMKLSFHETTNEAALTLSGPFASLSFEF